MNQSPGANDQLLRPEMPDKDSTTQVVKLHNVPIHVNTPSGAAWVRKYEHPPAPTPPEYSGIPDINNSPSYRTEYRAVQNIQTYSSSTDPVPVITNYNKVLFLQMPSVIAPVISFKYTTAGVLTQLPEDVILNPSIDTRSQLGTTGSGRLAYKSATYDLNSTDFNNQGTVTTASFRPNVSTYTNETVLSLIKKRSPKQLEKFTSLFSTQSQSTDRGFQIIKSNGDAAGNVILVLTVGTIPVTSTDVAQLSPNATVVPAKEGAFVVQRFSQPTTPYVSYADSSATYLSPWTRRGRTIVLEFVVSESQSVFYPITSDQYSSTAGILLEDLALFDMTCAWVMFDGLSVQPASSSATTVTPPYITVKSITGYEAQAFVTSPLVPFMENSAVYDAKALEFGAMITHAKCDALPARYNFWGALGQGLLAAAPGIISTLKSVFSKPKADKPAASQQDEQRLVSSEAINKQLWTELQSLQAEVASMRFRNPGPQQRVLPAGRPAWADPSAPVRIQMARPARSKNAARPTAKRVNPVRTI